MPDIAIIGPPWRVIERPDPSAVFAVDSPDLVGCDVFAAFVPKRADLIRARDEDDAVMTALALAEKHDSEAWVLKGALGLRSGRWLFLGPPHKVGITKGPSANSREGLAVFTDRLQRQLKGAASPAELEALEEVFSIIGVDPGALSAVEAEALLSASSSTIAAIGGDARLLGGARVALSGSAVQVANGTRAALGSRVLRASGINRSMALQDRRALQRMARGRVGFFTNEYGRRSASFDRLGRRIVQNGLRTGIDSRQIAGDLRRLAGRQITGRSEHYYRVVAAAMVSQARSFGQMTGYRDAGIGVYEWEAVLDQRTCDICRYLHGQRFTVGGAMGQFAAADRAGTPEDAANETAWYRSVANDDGSRSIFVSPRGAGPTTLVANILSSAVGQVGRTGSFSTIFAPQGAGGTTTPPAHGGCRCTTIPVIE